MAKAKRAEIAEAKDDGYEFKIPEFNEQAFVRREILSARASFYTLAIGTLAGVISTFLWAAPLAWQWGWVPILVGMLALRPILQALKFPEDVLAWKALIGSYFMLFFTGLSIWIIGVNLV